METMIKTDNLTVGYHKGKELKPILSNLNIEIKHGELICLLGPNGTGKSTLIRTLCGMQAPLAGNITIKNEPLTTLNRLELAKQLGVVLTNRILPGVMTVYNLVAMGRYPYTNWIGKLTKNDENIINQAIEQVGLQKLAHRNATDLSDGEKQKVMIARALAQNTDLIILDEPTAFLDLPRRVELMRLLRKLAHEQNKAILCSSHDLVLSLRSADIVWLISEDGKIRTGAAEDLVLSDAFNHTFETGGVFFDKTTGMFEVHDKHSGTVILNSDNELYAFWTKHALERAGFDVVSESKNPAYNVTVKEEDNQTTWIINDNHEASSLYELVKYLSQK